MRGAAELTEIPESVRTELPAVRKLERLALLYEGVLTVTGRVHTGRQRLQDPEEFRTRMKQALEEVAKTAARRGYARSAEQEATFAVVAFLDEAILTAPDAGAGNWVGKSLGEELFDQRSAGELFFKRLDGLRAQRDSQDLAEVLEVYSLCLLLGYEGKFAGGAKGELLQMMANLRERIERIYGGRPGPGRSGDGHGRAMEFSPDRELGGVPAPVVVAVDPMNRQLRLFALAALLFAVLCYAGFSWQLHSQTREIHRLVVERVDSGRTAPPGERP